MSKLPYSLFGTNSNGSLKTLSHPSSPEGLSEIDYRCNLVEAKPEHTQAYLDLNLRKPGVHFVMILLTRWFVTTWVSLSALLPGQLGLQPN